jgi:tRNA A-37 threonylcarbamoyl transferase component Bud32
MDLRHAGTNVRAPFDVSLPGDAGTLSCQKLLRLLPGKRVVCDASWNNERVIAKLFVERKHFSKERDGLQALQDAGISTPRIVAQFENGTGGLHIILIEYLKAAENLKMRLQTAVTGDENNGLLKRTMAILAAMHDAGLTQQDIHLDNFLVNAEGIHVIDGGAVCRHRQPLAKRTAADNLGKFFAQIEPLDDTVVRDIYSAYKRAGAPARGQVMKALVRRRRWRRRRYVKKTTRNCTEFIARHKWDRLIVYRRDHDSDEFTQFLEDPNRFMATGTVLKSGNTATVALMSIDGKQLVVKRYNIKHWRHALRRFWRPSRAWISWLNGHRLTFTGVSTPTPVAVIECRWGPLRGRAFYVSAYVDGDHLSDYVASLNNNNHPIIPGWLEQQVVTFFRMLSRERLSHGDMKANNLLLVNHRLSVIDLDSIRQHRYAWRWRRAFRRDLERFLRNWEGRIGQHFDTLLRPMLSVGSQFNYRQRDK